MPIKPKIQVVGDIAKLWNIDINALKSATDFFKEYYQEYAELLECDYLKKTLSLLWKKAINVASDEDCDSGIGFYKELISLDPEDFWSYWMLGKFSEKTNPEEALNWYIQSAVTQNTSKGYGGLISKIKDYRKTQRLPKDIELEYLDLQEKAAMKAIECDAINLRNWDALSDALEDKGRVFKNQRKYQKAINNFDSAIKADEKRVEIGEMLQILPHGDEILYHYRIHKIAGILSERADANEQLGRLDNTIRDLDAAIAKWSSGGRRLGDADAAIKRLSKDKERIEEVTQNLGILKYLCDVANAAIEGEKSIVDLRETMYWFKKLLEEVNPGWIEGDIDEVTGDTEKDHNRRMEALNTFLFNINCFKHKNPRQNSFPVLTQKFRR